MKEPTMPIEIFMDGKVVYNGELVPNGPGLAISSDTGKSDFLNYEADTNLVEAKIPMEIMRNDTLIGCGELYQSGEYFCLCPTDQDVDLMDTDAVAQLFMEKQGQMAKLDIRRGN